MTTKETFLKTHRTLKIITGSLLFLLPSLYILGESFVTPKKKTPSINKLKEECCQECATILELTPELLRAIANIQQTALSNVRCYMDDGKEGFIATKSKEQLVTSHEKLVALRTDLEALTKQINSARAFLETGYCQFKPKA